MSSNKISNSWNKCNADALIKRLSEEDRAALSESAEVLNDHPLKEGAAKAIDDCDEEVESEDEAKSNSFNRYELLDLNKKKRREKKRREKECRNSQNREEKNKSSRKLLFPMSDIKKWFKQEYNILSNSEITVCLCERISKCNTVLRRLRFEQRYSLLPCKCSWCAPASDDKSCDTSSESDSEKPNRVFVFSPAYVECQGEPYSDDACCSSYLPCEYCDRGYKEKHC